MKLSGTEERGQTETECLNRAPAEINGLCGFLTRCYAGLWRPNLASSRGYIGFWSYARFDDRHDEKWLTNLRKALENEVKAISGAQVEIFQDVDGIEWGERWKPKIDTTADDAVFLIPIITPTYFQSAACREELEHFVKRENDTGFRELILPLYYIDCAQLESTLGKGADPLASVVVDHNYRDIRSFRHKSLSSYRARNEITAMAKALQERLEGFARWQLSSDRMSSNIIVPASFARVPRTPVVLGNTAAVPGRIEVWLAVEVNSLYHPQVQLPKDRSGWQATAILGRSELGIDSGHEFRIHVLAVTEAVSGLFYRYLSEGHRHGWSGVPKPAESNVLTTAVVVRDDSASPFAFLEGAYDEYGSDGAATGGLIRMKQNSFDQFATEARNREGTTQWTGTVKIIPSSNPLRGEGGYRYSARADWGRHMLTVVAGTRDLNVDGKNQSHPEGLSFKTAWKRRV